MTPATAAGLAKLAGADLIAVTDHNSALSLPAAKAACDAYGLQLLPRGNGVAVAQSHSPGTTVTIGTQIAVDFRE